MAAHMHHNGTRGEQLIETGRKNEYGETELKRRRAYPAPWIPSAPAGKRWQNGKLVSRYDR